MIEQDDQAYLKYKRYRKWFNKLYVSEILGYDCGPSGIAPTKSGKYVVRPIYNLSGMGVGAEVKEIEAGDISKTPPGYFWCEFFEGNQYSVDYEFIHGLVGEWRPLSCYRGVKNETNLSKFTSWHKDDYYPDVPRQFNELSEVRIINIEFIEDKPIEVHLRKSPDPKCEDFVPIWSEDQETLDFFTELGYTYIESYEDADGFLETPRLGFMIR